MSAMIDLSTVTAPHVVEPLNYEALLGDLKAELLRRYPDVAGVIELESEPLVKLMQVMAYREVLLRQRINEAARALMLAYAVDTDLEQIGANYGIQRLPGEGDERLRQRIQQAYSGLAAAGPAAAYRQHAMGVSADVRDVQVFSEAPGSVTVSVLALATVPTVEADTATLAAGLALFGPCPQEGCSYVPQPTGGPLLLQVLQALNANDVRPLTDRVIVRAPQIIHFAVHATLQVLPGPDPQQVLQRRQKALDAYLQAGQVQGASVTLTGITAALVEPAVQDVRLAAPLSNIHAAAGQMAVCTEITLGLGVLRV